MIQSMMMDHFRNAYLQYVAGKKSADANSSAAVREAFERAGWDHFWKKFGLRWYLNYTRQQELLAPALLRLRLAAEAGCDDDWREAYRRLCFPLIKWCNLLATTPRMLLLFTFLLLGQPVWYFVVEVTLLNLLFLYLMLRHESIFRSLRARLRAGLA